MEDLKFYIDMYVDQGFSYEESEMLAKNLLACIGVIFEGKA